MDSKHIAELIGAAFELAGVAVLDRLCSGWNF